MLCGLICLYQVWNVFGSFCSVVSPYPMDARSTPGSNAGWTSIVMVLVPLCILGAFVILYFLGTSSGHRGVALTCCLGAALLATGANHMVYRPWLRERLDVFREDIYFKLVRPGAV